MAKILAIDDSEINLELLYQIIKLHYPEYQFMQATSGQEGIELAINEQPEIILLDIIMPNLNGYEVCHYLKSEKSTQHIPIIMISALGQNSDERTRGLNAGADAFISKPFSQNELRAQINVALRIKKVEDLLRRRNESLEVFIKDQTNKYLKNEERYLQITAHTLEFYWEIDPAGIFTYISPVIEKIFQSNPVEIIGRKDFSEFFQLQGGNKKNSRIEISIQERKSFNDLEISLKMKGRDKLWFSVSGFPVINEKQDFYGMRGVCIDITKRKQAEIALKKYVRQIEKYQKKLKHLNNELTLVEEKERRRIAENLHDSLGQTLSLAFMKLSSVPETAMSSHTFRVIQETSELLNKAIQESRTLTYDLSPPILYELGLIPAFNWKLRQISDKHGLRTQIRGEDVHIDIRKEYNIFLYRILSELINNVVKHAGATRVLLSIQKNKAYYMITLEDNGKGFDTDLLSKPKETGGFGLMSITERLDSIKGQFIIESSPGKGTKATVLLPLNED